MSGITVPPQEQLSNIFDAARSRGKWWDSDARRGELGRSGGLPPPKSCPTDPSFRRYGAQWRIVMNVGLNGRMQDDPGVEILGAYEVVNGAAITHAALSTYFVRGQQIEGSASGMPFCSGSAFPSRTILGLGERLVSAVRCASISTPSKCDRTQGTVATVPANWETQAREAIARPRSKCRQ